VSDKVVSGVNCHHWTIQGNEVNNLYENVDNTSIICLLDNSGSDIFTALPGTFALGPPDPSLFNVQTGCTGLCPAGTPHCATSFPELEAPIEAPTVELPPIQRPSNPHPNWRGMEGGMEERNEEKQHDKPTKSDLIRAETRTPRQPYRGAHMNEASERLNEHLLARTDVKFKSCDSFNLTELDHIQTLLRNHMDSSFDSIYQPKGDPRRHHVGDSMRAVVWDRMHRARHEHSPMLRDGRCREIVMWFIHHLTENGQTNFGKLGVILPLLPPRHHTAPTGHDEEAKWAHDQYQSMATCQQCHL